MDPVCSFAAFFLSFVAQRALLAETLCPIDPLHQVHMFRPHDTRARATAQLLVVRRRSNSNMVARNLARSSRSRLRRS